jgi:hypothetical protein
VGVRPRRLAEADEPLMPWGIRRDGTSRVVKTGCSSAPVGDANMAPVQTAIAATHSKCHIGWRSGADMVELRGVRIILAASARIRHPHAAETGR